MPRILWAGVVIDELRALALRAHEAESIPAGAGAEHSLADAGEVGDVGDHWPPIGFDGMQLGGVIFFEDLLLGGLGGAPAFDRIGGVGVGYLGAIHASANE